MCGEDLSLNTNTEISLGMLHSAVQGGLLVFFFFTFPHLKNYFFLN